MRSLLNAITLPYSYDEIRKLFVCRLPSASAIWNALEHGLDEQPPA
jgi:hypothetical protein